MGMTPIPLGIDSHQRLWYIVIEYSNTPISAQRCTETVNTDETFLSPFFYNVFTNRT